MPSKSDIKTCLDAMVYEFGTEPVEAGPTIVVIEGGYADVWVDGDVTQHGRVVFNCIREAEEREMAVPDCIQW